MANKIFILLKKIYLFFFVKDYKRSNINDKLTVFISYLSEPFYKKNDAFYMKKHQNRRETLIMNRIFQDLNYSVHFRRFDKKLFFPEKYDIIFGIETNFARVSLVNKDSLKIYYATGAYYMHQNKMVIDRTNDFNLNHNTNLPYIRTVNPHNSCEIADYIIQIGSKYTVETYPESIRSKIIPIRQSCHIFNFENYLEEKIQRVKKNHFIWMGSRGSILKGLDIILDFFLIHKEYHLHIVGEIDQSIHNYYKDKLLSVKSIHLYGFLDLDSEVFKDISQLCAFVLMPSASEGMPGSVINLMKLGCIPIVSKYAAFDQINEYGYLIESFNVQSLEDTIEVSQSLDKECINKKIHTCYKFANDNFNEKTFYEDFLNAFCEILKKTENSKICGK